MSDNVQEDSIVVLEDCSVGDELGDHRTITVDFIFQEGIEVLVVGVVWHDDQEEELRVFDGSIGVVDHRQHLFIVVVLDGRGEGIQEKLFVNEGLVCNWANVCILNLNIETFLLRQVVEFIVYEVSVVHIPFKADDGESLEGFWLVHHLVETVGVLKWTRVGIVRVLSRSLATTSLVLVVVAVSLGLLSKVWSFKNLWLIQYFCLDSVRIQLNIKTPLFHLLRFCDHFI